MASLRSLIARLGDRRNRGIAALAATFFLPAGLGCTSLSKTKSEFAQALHLEAPKPASQMICFWQRRPQYLPDPSRDGVMAPGLVGQMFLISPDNKSADITGDLVVQATDETKRPQGQPAAMSEVWHIDKTTLKKLSTKDERFGTCYALFLPWPANWKDVTNVRMQAKYISKPNADLFASDVQMTLEFNTPGSTVWNDSTGGFGPSGQAATAPVEMRGIPDLNKVFQTQPAGTQNAARPLANGSPPNLAMSQPNAAPTGMFLPPPQPGPPVPGQYTTAGPAGSTVTTKTWTSPLPTQPGNYAPTVIPPVEQTTFGQPLPIQLAPQQQPFINLHQQSMPLTPAQQPNAGQPVHLPTFLPLPPAIPTADANRWGAAPGPNGGLPPANVPTGPLQSVVIPRY